MIKPVLREGTNYTVLPRETLAIDLEPGDRFTNYGRTYVVFEKKVNPKRTKVQLKVRAVTDHYKAERTWQPTGRELTWSSLIGTSFKRLIYRPDTWNADDEPVWFEYIIDEDGYAIDNSEWWKKEWAV